MLLVVASISPVAATPLAAMEPSAPTNVGTEAGPFVIIETAFGLVTTAEANVLRKTVDFTKGEHRTQPSVLRLPLAYCAPQSEPLGCIRYEPTLSWSQGCDAGALLLDMTYVNEMRREVPVDTSSGDFTDTAYVPAKTAAGPGVYFLRFRLSPSQQQLVTGHWEGVTFSRNALRTEVSLCP
ncbi:MAG TPA: hypothetical protein VFT87_02175 [Candidatus Saccharimonadales bacterium]|nr:hypothetical protein [Candidatus Saccharimonadales bacterium]